MTNPVCDPRVEIDPRGPRFGAVITVIVLALALIFLNSTVGLILLVWQAIAFGLGAFVGLRAAPYGAVYRALVQPRLAPPSEFEAAAPPRFAQLVGFVFVAVALVGLLVGLPVLATVAVAFALGAAFLNAAFGLCLGCEMYLIGRRVLVRS
jgi:hypothetical protein